MCLLDCSGWADLNRCSRFLVHQRGPWRMSVTLEESFGRVSPSLLVSLRKGCNHQEEKPGGEQLPCRARTLHCIILEPGCHSKGLTVKTNVEESASWGSQKTSPEGHDPGSLQNSIQVPSLPLLLCVAIVTSLLCSQLHSSDNDLALLCAVLWAPQMRRALQELSIA